jgi:hypothetical protein
MIKINLDKAKEIHKEKIRQVRKPLLQQLDVDFIRTLELGGDTQEIAAKKQALRDATDMVTNAKITGKTVDTVTTKLKAIWDEELLGTNPFQSS